MQARSPWPSSRKLVPSSRRGAIHSAPPTRWGLFFNSSPGRLRPGLRRTRAGLQRTFRPRPPRCGSRRRRGREHVGPSRRPFPARSGSLDRRAGRESGAAFNSAGVARAAVQQRPAPGRPSSSSFSLRQAPERGLLLGAGDAPCRGQVLGPLVVREVGDHPVHLAREILSGGAGGEALEVGNLHDSEGRSTPPAGMDRRTELPCVDAPEYMKPMTHGG